MLLNRVCEHLAGRWEAAAQPHFTVAPAVRNLHGHGTSSQVGPFTQVPVPACTEKATGHKQESPETHVSICVFVGSMANVRDQGSTPLQLPCEAVRTGFEHLNTPGRCPPFRPPRLAPALWALSIKSHSQIEDEKLCTRFKTSKSARAWGPRG